ncbi:cupin domain-containing protein [Niabella beijingensis]|uniref:cupin domain-containing protein n=1 Tax=Niabella beijingensis TaxID=2872700 RepID=UPI001CBF8DED|nr:cupin domain-containing protein [Niabella beijingensis]MBZ4188210.1 cupin domain-containing protein [Niabella beijingensis]
MPTKENKVVHQQQPISAYAWGVNCNAYVLSGSEHFSVKKESIPSGSGEQFLLHHKATQFFYILEGTASFEIDGAAFEVNAGQGIEIFPGQAHRISNNKEQLLEFIVYSTPSTDQDRLNLHS